MKKFPSGKWVVHSKFFSSVDFGTFEYEAASNTAHVRGMDRQAGIMMSGGHYGKRTKMTGVRVDGYVLRGRYHTLKRGSPKTRKDWGEFVAKIRPDASLKIWYTKVNLNETATHLLIPCSKCKVWHTCTASPKVDSLKPNLAGAGLRHQVRLNANGGVGVKALGSVMLGNVEVRDLGAGWETHYAFAAAGGGASLGISLPLPRFTSWKRMDLSPGCKDWTGTTVSVFTAGMSAILTTGQTGLELNFKGQQRKLATWTTPIGVAPEVKIDLGTAVIGKLMGKVFSKPYLAGA